MSFKVRRLPLRATSARIHPNIRTPKPNIRNPNPKHPDPNAKTPTPNTPTSDPGGHLDEYQGAEIAVEGGLVRGTLQARVPHPNRRRLLATYKAVKAYVRQSRHM